FRRVTGPTVASSPLKRTLPKFAPIVSRSAATLKPPCRSSTTSALSSTSGRRVGRTKPPCAGGGPRRTCLGTEEKVHPKKRMDLLFCLGPRQPKYHRIMRIVPSRSAEPERSEPAQERRIA